MAIAMAAGTGSLSWFLKTTFFTHISGTSGSSMWFLCLPAELGLVLCSKKPKAEVSRQWLFLEPGQAHFCHFLLVRSARGQVEKLA